MYKLCEQDIFNKIKNLLLEKREGFFLITNESTNMNRNLLESFTSSFSKILDKESIIITSKDSNYFNIKNKFDIIVFEDPYYPKDFKLIGNLLKLNKIIIVHVNNKNLKSINKFTKFEYIDIINNKKITPIFGGLIYNNNNFLIYENKNNEIVKYENSSSILVNEEDVFFNIAVEKYYENKLDNYLNDYS